MILLPSIFHGILGMITISVIAFSLLIPSVFADDSETWKISIVEGASNSDSENTFFPNELPVDDGDFVEWTNQDTVAHSIASGLPKHPDYQGEFFNAGLIEPGEKATVQINRMDGFESFYYVCQIHPWMTGKIFTTGTTMSMPETPNPVLTEKNEYQTGDKVAVSGQVHQDFWGTDYQLLVYNGDNQLLDIITGDFDDESNFSQIIDTNVFEKSGQYTLKLVYALPSKAAETQFNFSKITTNSNEFIPTWIKNVGEYWCSNQINDEEFVNAIEFLINKGIINVDSSKIEVATEHQIPDWVKNNTCWWSDDKITDVDFLSGIEFLVNKGTIII